jgi:hypothetical protein
MQIIDSSTLIRDADNPLSTDLRTIDMNLVKTQLTTLNERHLFENVVNI